MSLRNLSLWIGICFFLSGCATKEPSNNQISSSSSTLLTTYPQSVDALAKNVSPTRIAQDDFTYRYYSPWFRTHLSEKKDDASWANKSYGIKGRYYGENLQLIDDQTIDAIIKNTHFDAFGSVNAHAIMIENAQMRNLPSDKPFFKKTTLPGEGYPFDYLQ